jgi:hypothetical protein
MQDAYLEFNTLIQEWFDCKQASLYSAPGQQNAKGKNMPAIEQKLLQFYEISKRELDLMRKQKQFINQNIVR